jgi:hypothetical protein
MPASLPSQTCLLAVGRFPPADRGPGRSPARDRDAEIHADGRRLVALAPHGDGLTATVVHDELEQAVLEGEPDLPGLRLDLVALWDD